MISKIQADKLIELRNKCMTTAVKAIIALSMRENSLLSAEEVEEKINEYVDGLCVVGVITAAEISG